jgi:GlcNAc-P-P-Und epimerase
MSEKILLTGGSGFIGSHFHNAIPNDQIVNLDLQAPVFSNKALFVQGDIRKEQDVHQAIAGKNITCIISLAAKHHDFGIGHSEYFDTNEDGTRIICKVAAQNNIKDIIFYSSVAVYGIREEVSTESMEPKPDGAYGASKLAGEKVLEQWAAEDATRKVLVIRPTVVFGANNRANMFNLIRQIDSGLYFHLGSGANIKSIAYVENLVQATLFLKNKMKPGVEVYNYADEPQLTSRQIGDVIAKSLDKKIWLTIPKPLAVLVGLPFDALIKITGKNLPISSARIKKLGTETHHVATKIIEKGFVPRFTTVNGLEKMVAWYRATKNELK